MNLYLNTVTVWFSEDIPNPFDFFSSLESIVLPSDFLVLGSYEWPEITQNWLLEREIFDPNKPYTTSFDLNREQYPNGKDYIINMSQENILELSSRGGVFESCNEFLDHLLVYRGGKPVIPLINYRYSFKKSGRLYFSGFYPKDMIESVSSKLNITISELDNPIINLDCT